MARLPILRLVPALALAALVLAGPLPSQTAAAPVAPQTAPQAPQAEPTAKSVPTIKARTDLVVVDVVVSDKNQNPIHDLKQSDFTLLEDGKPQTVKNFEEHRSLSAADAAKLAPMPKMPPGYFTNYSPAPANGAIDVLLLDTLNTPMADQSFVRTQLLKYLKNAPPGERIAIFGLTTHLIMLQGFTSNPEVLKAAVEGKAGPKGSVLLNDAVNNGSDTDTTMSDALSDSMGSDPSSAQIMANVQQFEAQMASFQLQLRAQYTLDAMNQLARYLVSLPGRKNLIWFSGSFPLNVLPDGDLSDPFAAMMSVEDEYRETTNLLARSQVAVYPIDARGLMTNNAFDVSQSGRAMARDPKAAGKAISKFNDQTNSEHSTMMAMAEDTGGRAFVNTNDLSSAVAKAVEAGSNYYTLTYSPTNNNWNGQFRKIQVNLQQQGLNLAYRHGYFSDDPESPHKHDQQLAATAPARSSAVSVALMRGAPDPTEIRIEARLLPASTTTEENVATGNELNPDPKLKIKGPYRRFVLDFAVDTRNIQFAFTPDGNYHCAVEFATLIYDRDGNRINSAHMKIAPALPAAAYAGMMRNGATFSQEISVPVKGEYFLRTAVHDLSSDRVGGIEVPIASVAHLAPLPSQPATAPSTAPPVGASPPAK